MTRPLGRSYDILAAVSASGSLPIVFEAPAPDIERLSDVDGSALRAEARFALPCGS